MPARFRFRIEHRLGKGNRIFFNQLFQKGIGFDFAQAVFESRFKIFCYVGFHIRKGFVFFVYVLRQFIVQIGKIALFKGFKRYTDFFCLTCKLGIFKILVPGFGQVFAFSLFHADNIVVEFIDILAASDCKDKIFAFGIIEHFAVAVAFPIIDCRNIAFGGFFIVFFIDNHRIALADSFKFFV